MFFNNITSIDELKRAYRNLAKQHHPDHGGNAETMQAINREYEQLFKALNTENKFDMKDGFREVINQIINLEISIEICGSWIWVSGNTYAVKSKLKSVGFMWASKKHMWYWRPEEAACHRSKGQDMNSIREKYGSHMVKGVNPQGPFCLS